MMLLTNLPLEVLMHILDQLRPERTSEPYLYDISTIRAIARVNKHCCRSVEPILYSSVRLHSWYTSDVQLRRRQQVLVRKLEALSRLHSCIRHLSLNFVTWELSAMLKTLAQCANLAILTLNGTLTEDNHGPLRELITTSKLQELRLSKECAGPVIGLLLSEGAPSNLKVLKVHESVSRLAPFSMPPSTVRSNIEELVILTNFWPDDSILTLMQWPRQLKVFKYSVNREFYNYYSPPGDDSRLMYGMPALQQLLDMQSGTLEHIDIDVDFSNEWYAEGPMVDLSLYANLKWFKVYDHLILYTISPEHMCSSLPRDLACLEVGISSDEKSASDV